MTAVTGELLASTLSPTDTQIVLPDKLSAIKKAEKFSSLKLKWNSSEEVLSILISFDRHESWFSEKVPTRPPNGSMLLFHRKNIKDYRKDGYTWKKRTSSSSYIREDHCKLKVSGVNNPDIVLVHYLNLLDDLSEQYTYVCERQKANISYQINSIFSGIEEDSIPKFEITEEQDTNSQTPGHTPQPPKIQNNKKQFKITITPAISDDLPPSLPNVLQQRVNIPYVNQWMRNNDGTNPLIAPKLPDTHPKQLPSCSGATVLFSPVCSVRTLPNQSRNSPVKSNGLNTQSVDLPTSVVRFPGTVTSSINVPIGYIQTPQTPITEINHNVPPTPETIARTMHTTCTSNKSTHPQPNYANSVGVGTQPLLFFSSASIPAVARAASTLNLPNNNGVLEMNYSVANTPFLTENTTTTTTNTVTSSSVFVQEPGHNGNSTLVFQFRPLELTQGNNGPYNSPLGNKGPSNLSQANNGSVEPVQNGSFQNNSSIQSNIPLTTSPSASTLSAFNDVTLTSDSSIPINGPPRSHFQDSLTEARSSANQQPAPVELSSSPSSDYGSLLSESGTRFSGSESMSSELGSNSCENGFDGPFRLPLPVTQGNRGSTQFRLNTILSSSHTMALPGHANEAECYHRDTSTQLDSNPVDMAFDLPELHSLDELDYDGLNFDLNAVLGEYFNSPETVPQTFGENSAMEGRTHNSTGHPLDDARWRKQENGTGVARNSQTRGETSSSRIPPAQTASTSTLQVNDESSHSGTCRTPVNDVVMTTSHSPSPQSMGCNSDDVTAGRLPLSYENEGRQDEAEGNNDSNNHSCAPEVSLNYSCGPEVSSNSSLLPAVVPGSACISDFSPEWSYPEGGVKILVTGEWSSSDISYTCLFDGCSVEANLVQVGVLRCYCPPHEPGLVTLQVACNGFIVSNACVFEYRTHDSPGDLNTHHEWLAMDDARFKLALLDRLERLESRLGVQTSAVNRTHSETRQQQCRTFEERIIVTCRALFEASAASGATSLKRPYRGMTLMHLASAVGFSTLLRDMTLKWQDPLTSELIRLELDPSRKDEFNCTPLMWACALGQRAAVAELLCCHANSLLVPDACGRLPLQVARDRGYFEIVDCIEEFMMASPERRSVFNLYSSSEDEDETSESNVPSPSRLTTSSSSGTGHYSSPSLETSFTDRACSPMHVEEVTNGGVLLNQALVQIHEMINEAERQADMDNQILAGRLPMQLSPVQEEVSPGGWGSSGSRFRSFSSASSQSSPLTPSSKSSLSPGSPAFLNSPHSSPSVPPDTKEFHEFLCSSKKLLEKNFSELTLTDREQQELYEAALIIQEAYRSYKIRRQQHDEEMQAAVLIQNHYRRYKQFLLYKKRTHAALIIQNQYRAYREHELFKKSRRAAAIIQNQFRIYRRRRQKRRDEHKSKQQEARFMRQSSNR
ncbi:hypothetical protein QZH41_017788 [Actinostola sp. cb2023]|nr:hypothetical protein QZH41_017788 [Actinostola sp. cb2023]